MASRTCTFCGVPCRYSASRGMACDSCYCDMMYGFAQVRREAERVANVAGQNFVVVELDPTSNAARMQAKHGRKAYSVWAAGEKAAAFLVVEEYAPGIGRVYQCEGAP